MHKDANISGSYRYSLSRIWDRKKKLVLFIGLNPSTADHRNDDHTITQCIRFAKSWECGGILVANLFAYRATNPRKLEKVNDPVGLQNNRWIKKLSKRADMNIAVWGNKGNFLRRNEIVRALLKQLYCLQLTKSGHPHHPRGLSRHCKPFLYK